MWEDLKVFLIKYMHEKFILIQKQVLMTMRDNTNSPSADLLYWYHTQVTKYKLLVYNIC